jgi:hypothetical protein
LALARENLITCHLNLIESALAKKKMGGDEEIGGNFPSMGGGSASNIFL